MIILKKIFNLIPYIFISYIFSSILLLAFIAVFKFNNEWELFLNLFHLLFFLISLLILRKYKNNFYIKNFQKFNYLLCFFGLILILYRFPIYFHALDDYVLHMVSGYYALSAWSSNGFLSVGDSSYLYPLLQTAYYPLINNIGIRLTVLLLSLVQFIWFLGLNLRFNKLFENKNKLSHFYINLFFIFLYFLPELVLTHTLFMSDFYTVLFSLEITYLFLSKTGNKGLMVILMILAVLTKQSSGLFIVILFTYFFFSNFKKICKTDWTIISIIIFLIGVYCIRSYFETGNPLGFLYNGVFKSPLYNLINARDLRWGPVGWKEILIWPLVAFNDSKYIEWIVLKKPVRLIFSLFLIIPYLTSLYLLIKKKKIIYIIIFSSLLFWSWQSGYGRYQTSMTAIIWILLFDNVIQFLPKIKNNLLSKIFIFVFATLCFMSIKNDYALRGFILDEFWPPKISTHYKRTYIEGLKLLGKDRYIDIYNSIDGVFDGYKQIVVVFRGGVTFYSFLAEKYNKIPVYSYIDKEQKEDILLSNKISENIKEKLSLDLKNKPILLMADLDAENQLKKSYIFSEMDCIKLNRDKIAPQFQSDHYFNYVEEYSCK